jgi:hypothetical protein
MTFKVTQKKCILIPYLQPFKNGERLNFWGGCNESRRIVLPRTYCSIIKSPSYTFFASDLFIKTKLKQSHYTPQRRLGGEEV